MSNIEHSKVEDLFWNVHDDCMSWLTDARERTVTVDEKLDRLMLAISHLAVALAGGYRKDGLRQ
jgi:hypothetical protein